MDSDITEALNGESTDALIVFNSSAPFDLDDDPTLLKWLDFTFHISGYSVYIVNHLVKLLSGIILNIIALPMLLKST